MEELLKMHADQVLVSSQVVNVNIDGYVLTDKYIRYKEAILNFEVRDDDILVCTFPKTGTTWTQEMVWLIANNLDYESATAKLLDRYSFIEFAAMNNIRVAEPAVTPEEVLDKLQQKKGRRFIKTHLPWELLPKQIQNGTKKAKIFYVTRDPRDVCVSYYHHCRLLRRISYELDKFCELFLADKTRYQPFWKHVFGFWRRRNEDNILFLRYEELEQDLPSIIKKVSAFLEVHLTEEDVRKLAEHLSFANMKDNPAVNYKENVKFLKEKVQSNYEGQFMRSGCSGSYKESLVPETVEKFNEWIRENTSRTDFTFYND